MKSGPRSDFDPANFPSYSKGHLDALLKQITPIEELKGYQIKRDDRLSLGGIKGGKVRQCLTLVRKELSFIRKECNGGIMTAANLPSPQVAIVASVARYFGLECVIVAPRYKNSARDFNRINVSIAQHNGAKVYGAKGTRPSKVEADGRVLQASLGYYMVKFGIAGNTETVIRATAPQVQNIPKSVKTIIMTGGSGLSGLGVLLGLKQYGKSHVKDVHFVTFAGKAANEAGVASRVGSLAGAIHGHFADWVHRLELDKAPTKWHFHESPHPYQTFYNPLDFEIDLVYESKAWKWMLDAGFKPSPELLFWNIGIREYDLDLITPIDWQDVPKKEPENPVQFHIY